MDEVDKKIVKILKNNSKTTLQNISEKINLSIAPTAVSYTHLTLPTKRIV